jgi:hypothetical protein
MRFWWEILLILLYVRCGLDGRYATDLLRLHKLADSMTPIHQVQDESTRRTNVCVLAALRSEAW